MSGNSSFRLVNLLFRGGVLSTLILAPAQLYLPHCSLTFADLALCVTFLLWGLGGLLSKDWRRFLKFPDWTLLLFVAMAAISVVAADDKGAAYRELARLLEWFILGAMVFDAFLREGGTIFRRLCCGLILTLTASLILIAVCQYHLGATPPAAVRGTFENQNLLGGYFALSLPLLFAGIFMTRILAVRILLGLFTVTGLCVTLSGPAYWAIGLAILGLSISAGWRAFLPTAALLVFLQVWFLPSLPRTNDLAHFDSVALFDQGGEPNPRYPEWQAAVVMALTHPDFGVGLGNYGKKVGLHYDLLPRGTGKKAPGSRNLYLLILGSCGFPTLFAFLGLLFKAVSEAFRAGVRAPTRELAWLSAGTAASLSAFSVTALWYSPAVPGLALPFIFLLSLSRHLSQPVGEVPSGKKAEHLTTDNQENIK